MDKYILSLEMLVVVGVYSLVWFIVGIKIGELLSGTKKGSSKKGKRKSNSTERRAPGKGCIEIYVGNLSYDLSESEIRKQFKEYGKVVSVRLIKNKFNGKSKGYGFIEMNNRNDAELAIRKMNNKDILGRRIIVNEAKTDARD